MTIGAATTALPNDRAPRSARNLEGARGEIPVTASVEIKVTSTEV
jgi:hypothetical protein